jgi:pyruvyl transferase EpsO
MNSTSFPGADLEAKVDDLVGSIGRLVERRPVALFDWPFYANAGDHFIWLGEKFILRHRLRASVLYECALQHLDFLRLAELPADTVFIMQGGGNFGDLYPHHQRLREAVIAAFPDRRIVMMPQTVMFRSQELMARSASLMARHPNLHVSARDRESFEIISTRMGLANCRLHIDPAFALQPIVSSIAEGIEVQPQIDELRLFRRDIEASDASLNREDAFDWSSPDHLGPLLDCGPPMTAIKNAQDIFNSRFDAVSWRRLCAAVRLFSSARRIATDRLHGHILALMMGKEHTLYDNNYGKNSAFCRAWTGNNPLLYLVVSHNIPAVASFGSVAPAGSERVLTRELNSRRDRLRERLAALQAQALKSCRRMLAGNVIATSLRPRVRANLDFARAKLRLPIAIDVPSLTRTGSGRYRVETRVDGVPVWIESDQPLRVSTEAFVAAFLFPAMAARRQLTAAGELDPIFDANLRKVEALAVEWWPFMSEVAVQLSGLRPTETGTGEAMFFTAGVDSFFTLWCNLGTVERLINVSGFDIGLWDTARIDKCTTLIDSIGRELGKQIVHVATNLRENALFQSVSWEVSHIAAISSIAHSISPRLATALVASTDFPKPWGSHPDLDPLWSSSALSILCHGREFSRLDKVRQILNWDIVRRSLRVCWENRAETLNCGCCEKCVRTQVEFIAAGADKLPETFPPGNLAERIDAIPSLPPRLCKTWRDIRGALPNSETATAVDRLLRRSERTTA